MDGINIPLFLIGDLAYFLKTWLMKPFTYNSSLTQQQQYYNYRLCKARIVVENAHGRLKARWRRLMKRNNMRIEIIPTVISAVCILHNICEIHGETFQECWFKIYKPVMLFNNLMLQLQLQTEQNRKLNKYGKV